MDVYVVFMYFLVGLINLLISEFGIKFYVEKCVIIDSFL